MACNNPDNIKIERVNVDWSSQHLIKYCIGAEDLAAVNGKYVLFSSLDTDYYAWIDVNNTGVDPAVAGRTEIEVDVGASPTAAQIATALAAAVDAVSGLNSSVDDCDDSCVLIQVEDVGAPNAVATAGTSGFTLSLLLQGAEFKLGLTDGDIEIPLAGENLVDITATQFGTNIVQRLRSGKVIGNITIPMKEYTAAKIKEILEAGGESFTPAGGTEVTGWGTSKDGEGVLAQSRKLIFHPIRLADNDLSEDIAFWRAYPQLSSIVLSGENNALINVEFSVLPDPYIDDRVQYFVYGDHSQNLLKS